MIKTNIVKFNGTITHRLCNFIEKFKKIVNFASVKVSFFLLKSYFYFMCGKQVGSTYGSYDMCG